MRLGNINEAIEAKLSVLIFFSALVFLGLFGVLGFLRSASLGADFLIFHKAALLFVEGANPWLLMKDSGEPFSYPPHIASLLMLYGSLPAKLALGLHTLINLVSVGVLLHFSNKWFIGVATPLNARLFQAIPLALIVGNPFMAHSVFEGQITLPCCAAVVLSWHFLDYRHYFLSGLFLAFASIKPQVAMFYIIWLMLTREFRVLIIGAAGALVFMLPALISLGPVEAFSSWFTSLQSYQHIAVNQAGSVHVVGLESFFTALGLGGTGLVLKLLAGIFIVALFIYRNYFSPILILNAFFVLPLTFIFGHDTGYAATIMLWSYLVFIALQSASASRLVIAGALCLIFFFPQRFLREIDFAALHHTRTFALILGFYFCARWAGKPAN